MSASDNRYLEHHRDDTFIEDLYVALLGRDPDEQGRNTYRDYLDRGLLSRSGVIQHLLSSKEFASCYQAIYRPVEEPFGCHRAEAEKIFGRFVRYTGAGRPGYITNFLGGVSDLVVSDLLIGHSGVVEGYPLPGNFHGETLEWLATLRAVLDSSEGFCLVELGAGWGPWCAISYLAAKQKGIEKIRVIGVEADIGHISFMRQHFRENNIADADAKIVHGVVGKESGTAYFPKARNAYNVYGGAAAYSDDDRHAGPFADFMEEHSGLIEEIEAVPCFALAEILSDVDIVDLVHCDIQGGEETLFPGTVDVLAARVRRVAIGTHSFEIDRQMVEIFAGNGWLCEGLSACVMKAGPNGPMLARDGMQVWRNPKLTA